MAIRNWLGQSSSFITDTKMRITVVGTGYVGLTVGACLAETGHEVICVDLDTVKIENLQNNILPIYEPGLEDLVKRNAAARRLRFSTDIPAGITWAEVVFSAVGTPPDKDHRADLTAVKQVAVDFGTYADAYKLFVNKSTVPVGTGKLCKEIILTEFKKRGVTFGYDQVSNPEFLREGVAVADCLKPDRIVVGAESEKAVDSMRKLYAPIIDKGSVFFTTNIESAEIIKYASNALLATKISFMNEIAQLSERVGGDIIAIERGVGLDDRIGRRFLHAGIGFGGSCFPKDVDALILTGKDAGYDFKIIQAVQDVNVHQKNIPFAKLKASMPDLSGKKIALWGLAFKPKTDDMREAPSVVLIKQLLEAGAQVVAFDPIAMEMSKKMYFADIQYAANALEAVTGADALVLVTECDEFRSVDFKHVGQLMKKKLVIDGRNIWIPADMRELGFEYYSIGRL